MFINAYYTKLTSNKYNDNKTKKNILKRKSTRTIFSNSLFTFRTFMCRIITTKVFSPNYLNYCINYTSSATTK